MKTKKWYVFLLLPVLVIIAGLVLLFTVGFSASTQVADAKSLVFGFDAFPTATEDTKDEFIALCNETAKDTGYIEYVYAETSNGGTIEYKYKASATADLNALGEALQKAVAENAKFAGVVTTYALHENTTEYTYTYIWRAAISAGVALVLAFLYILIRYQAAMGLAALLAGVLDTLSAVALALICRIPATPSLAVAAVFTTLFSVLVSTISFNKLREQLKSEEGESLSLEENVGKASGKAGKAVALFGGVSAVVLVALAIFCGTAIREFALVALCGVAIATYSAALLSPAVVLSLKQRWARRAAAVQEKRRLAELEAERAKTAKRKEIKE